MALSPGVSEAVASTIRPPRNWSGCLERLALVDADRVTGSAPPPIAPRAVKHSPSGMLRHPARNTDAADRKGEIGAGPGSARVRRLLPLLSGSQSPAPSEHISVQRRVEIRTPGCHPACWPWMGQASEAHPPVLEHRSPVWTGPTSARRKANLPPARPPVRWSLGTGG